MGRPRLPTTLKVLKGTLQPCRTNKDEPKLPAIDLPACPAHVPKSHRRWWDYVAFHASKLRCVTEADIPALECMVAVKAEIARMEADERNVVKEQKTLFDMLGKFGMTPSERSKVSGAPAPEENRLAKFKTYPGKA